MPLQGDYGRTVIVLVTDGRANVPLSSSVRNETAARDEIEPEKEGTSRDPSSNAPVDELKAKVKEARLLQRKAVREEVMRVARMIRGMPNIRLLVIDTENPVMSTGAAREIAAAAAGRYYCIPKASSGVVTRITAAAASNFK